MQSFLRPATLTLALLPLLAGCATSTAPTGNTAAPAATTVQVYETTASGSALLAKQPAVTFTSAAASGSNVIQVTPATALQPWDGVGGSLTDSAATVISALPSAQQQALLQQLFSSTSGVGFNMVRLPMGASDFSASGNYSYDDVAAGTTDTSLAHFSIAHDLTNIIPVLQSAQAQNANLKIIASPWSPPAWMKTNGSMNGSSSAPTTTSQIIAGDFPYLANYFVKFIQAYQAQGLPIYAVSSQNEPLNSKSSYPTAILTPGDEATFIANNLGPALSTAKLTTKIFALEDNYDDSAYAETVITSAADAYIAGSSFHWYEGVASSMSAVQTYDSSKGIWFTEGTGTLACSTTPCTLTGPTFSATGFAYDMQNLVMANIQNDARAVVSWNLALNQNQGPTNNGCLTCVGVVTVNTATSPATIYYNNMYYALGQVGMVATPGGNVISTTQGSAGGVQSVGFRNTDNTLGLVTFNGGTTSTTITVAWNNETFTYAIPAGAAVSFRWPAS
jgi:glucosylceramidase